MVTTRRQNGLLPGSKQTTSPSSQDHATSKTTIMPTTKTQPAYLPTPTEAILFAIYPLTLALGAAFSHFSPNFYPPANTSTYSHIHQSYQPADQAPSYFAQKRNVFNVYFVKIGWFWCTVALFVFVAFSSRGRRSYTPRSQKRSAEQDTIDVVEKDESDARLRRLYQTFFRYAVATVVWILVTQWCFGAPLIDRGFRLTGGTCAMAAYEVNTPLESRAKELEAALTHAACKAMRGQWRGGHDISGHVFLLVLGSGMIWLEMLPYLASKAEVLFGAAGGRVVEQKNGKVRTLAAEPDEEGYSAPLKRTTSIDLNSLMGRLKVYGTGLALFIGVLSWWMLLMTAAFFHTWLEKTTGFSLATGTLWIIYFLPRGLPLWRDMVGMPGV